MNTRSLPDQSKGPQFSWSLLACFAALGAPSLAHAVCTYSLPLVCLSNQPIQSASTVKPNIMVILDNSGSMASDYMPDSATSTSNCRQNWQYNTIYYNPNFDYTGNRPRDAMGNVMPSQSFTNAAIDPFATSVSYRNLSTNFCAQGGMAGTCSTGSSSTNSNAQPAYYYKYTGAGTPTPGNCLANGQYTKVVVSSSSCATGGTITQCPTGTDERENFANWYSYFRTRRLMVRSGLARAFAPLDNGFRVGFYTINSPSDSTFTNGAAQIIDDFSGGGAGTPKGNWFAKLFKVGGNSSTPLQTALDNIGQYYSGNPPSGLSGDPVQYSCQKNFAILSTDGYWNQTPPNRGNLDMTVPAMPLKQGATTYNPADTAADISVTNAGVTTVIHVPGLTPGNPFPKPYYEGSTATTNTLADIAMYYWVRDLRTSGAVADNNVKPSTLDPAYWQHMATYTIGLGVDGTLTYPSGLPTSTSGTNWPVPVSNGQTTIDDLWHAAINGHGDYYKADDPASLARGLDAALTSITNASTFSVGPASATSDFKSPDQSDFTTYTVSYNAVSWAGDVLKFNVDRTTGAKTGSELWSAARMLDSRLNPGLTSTINPTAYTTRNIVTRTETGTPVDFTFGALSLAQQGALCYPAPTASGCTTTPTTDRDSLVNYLRGDGTFEGDYGITGKRFRNRQDKSETGYFKRDLFGDVVNAGPAYVAAERRAYQDSTDPGFSAFKASSMSRSPTLYVPANDGMVHALSAATGDELWAYIPSFVIPTGLDEDGREKGLRALSYQKSGAPAYYHHFYVDATPVAAAVDFARTGGPITSTSPSGSWRTILVGGLGKGGKGYYALDATSPASGLSSAKAAVLWEFPSAADSSHASVISGGLMGYSFGQPLIVKTNAFGWVVIVPSGYNNADGYGYVFVLNAKTGALLVPPLKTPSQAPGLAHITGLVKFTNRFVSQLYGGDLNGNVWRFDVSDQNASNWTVSQIFSSSSATPITSQPDVSIDPNDGSRWLFFGTGKYLDVPDRATTGTQYLVALKDGTVSTPKTFASPVALSSLAAVSNLLTGVSSAPLGWRYALPASGERVAIRPWADLRTVVFASLVPTTDPCSPGTVGYAYGLEFNTGMSRLIINGTQVTNYYSSAGISSAAFQQLGTSATPGTGSGKAQLRIYTNDGQSTTTDLDMSKINSGTRHVGWRELLNEY